MIATKYPKQTAAVIAIASCVVTGVWFAWDYQRTPVLVLGPMVQQVGTDSFVLFWQVHPQRPVVARLFEDGKSAGTGLVSPQKLGRSIATFGGLRPDTVYEYELTCADRQLARHRVRTAPDKPRSFRFIAFGDSGTGGRSQRRLADRMPEYRPDFIIHTGDLIYPYGTLEDNPRKFFQPYAALLAEVPLYACLGNHECRVPGLEPVPQCFVPPTNGPLGLVPGHEYWFDYGDARFIAIDSNSDEWFFVRAVAPWLDEVLESAGNRWKIVFFHEPVYTHGRYPSAQKLLNAIVPVLERYHVEMVLCGHNHMYERTRPIHEGSIVPDGEGTIYVTTGAGGANLAEARLPMPATIAAWNDQEHSFTIADVAPDMIVLRQLGESGRLLDECHVHRAIASSQPATEARMGESEKGRE